MNDGDSAGRRRTSASPPAVIDRKLRELTCTGSAAAVAQMSQLQTSRSRVLSSDSQNTGTEQNQSTASAAFNANSKNPNATANTGSVSSSCSGGSVNVLRTQNVLIGSALNNASGTKDASKPHENTDLVSTSATSNASIVVLSITTTSTGLTSSPAATTTATTPLGCTAAQLQIRKRSAAASIDDSIISYKKRNLNHRLNRLKQINKKYNEHVAEIYFLQTGGNMMEFSMWRKKPDTPDFLNYVRRHPLDPPASEGPTAASPAIAAKVSGSRLARDPTRSNRLATLPQNQPPALVSTNSPHGVEIKIPGVGATPVAISTTLPAAVAQLTQQGKPSTVSLTLRHHILH